MTDNCDIKCATCADSSDFHKCSDCLLDCIDSPCTSQSYNDCVDTVSWCKGAGYYDAACNIAKAACCEKAHLGKLPEPGSRENYDPNQPVCNNQDDFNEAVNKAIKYNNKENMKKAKPWIYVYLVVWLIFLIWAIVLAMQIAPGHDRVVHLVFAIVFSPAYVLGYYLGAMSGSGGALMSMGSCGGPRY